jgi:DNA-binding FadR family transcriptional regulator
VSERLWQAVAAALPLLAGQAAARRGGASIRRSALLVRQSGNGPARAGAVAELLLAIARAADNPYLASLVSTCLANLLAEDRPFAERRTASIDADSLAEALASGDAAAAEAEMRQLLAPTRETERA